MDFLGSGHPNFAILMELLRTLTFETSRAEAPNDPQGFWCPRYALAGSNRLLRAPD